MQSNKLKDFIKENSTLIYEFINSEVLKGVGRIHPDYFVKIVNDVFVKQGDIKISEENLNIFPYFIFTLVEGKGKLDYTSLRVETIKFDEIDKESSVYYNYARFSLKNDFLYIDLMQSKIGGMPIDEDIVKFTKKIPIKSSAWEEFISQNKDNHSTTSNDIFKKLSDSI
jgi:hypothetical protein